MRKQGSIHFCGIGGTAMVAGARLALEAGWEVRGSDNPLYPPTAHMVEALGVPVARGYAAGNLDWNPDVVIIGNVLSRGNAEVEAALERRMRYMSLPEWLKEHVLRPRRSVAICGTHGKTTTTALTAHVLTQCGLDPGYLIGGQPLGFGNPARLGPEGGPFVIEGDEYDTAFFDKRAKFFHYLPEIAVVTSVEFDHGDIYPGLDDIDLAFQRMLRQVPASGWLVACAGNRAARLREHAPCQVCTYGLTPDADFRGEWRRDGEGAGTLAIFRNGAPWCECRPALHGRYNLENCLAAAAAAAMLGADPDACAGALASFPGVRRRMEVFLETGGVTFVDDFAHHPTAMREVIGAARERWPGRRLTVLFEPRSNTTVTRAFQVPLADALRGADQVWIGPVYREERIAPEERLDRDALARALEQQGTAARYTVDVDEIAAGLAKESAPGDVVLILSNGAFGGIYEKLRALFGGESAAD